MNKHPSKPTIEVAEDKKIEPKELISNDIDTTPTVYNNLKTKLPIKLEVVLDDKVSLEDKPSKQEVYSILLATMDDKKQAFFMGEKLDGTFGSPTTTPIHSYFHTQTKPTKVSLPIQPTKPCLSSKQAPTTTTPFYYTITSNA